MVWYDPPAIQAAFNALWTTTNLNKVASPKLQTVLLPCLRVLAQALPKLDFCHGHHPVQTMRLTN